MKTISQTVISVLYNLPSNFILIHLFILVPLGFGQYGTPNIVIILADDHSKDDAGAYGNKVVETPNINGLAAQSMLFR